MQKKSVIKPWGGRFSKSTHSLVDAFTSSIDEDYAIIRHDILGSIAHAKGLGKAKVLTAAETTKLVGGLKKLLKQAESGKLVLDPALEDVHMNIEVQLEKLVGAVAGKLHTGRSRNDQVATDMRLFLKEAICGTEEEIKHLQKSLVTLGEKHSKAAMPAYTHLQRAQPVLFAHHLLSYVEMLERDLQFLDHVYCVTDILPLGSGAATGSGFPIDRKFLARELGFAAVSQNSLDAVSDRDFVLQWYSAAALIMVHLSRLAEDLILWVTAEFDFVSLPDDFATGSSMMPQKKNPDVAELIRGRSATLIGILTAGYSRMKGLPQSYNRDLQEEKPAMIQSVGIVQDSLHIFAELFVRLRVKEGNMRKAAEEHHIIATDIADYLVKKGIPFRKAHTLVGKLVKEAAARAKQIHELPENVLATDGQDVRTAIQARIDIQKSLQNKNLVGGTSPNQVKKALAVAKRRLRESM